MGWLHRQAARAEARRWRVVGQLLRPPEQPILSVYCRQVVVNGGGFRGFVFLSTDRIFITEGEAPERAASVASFPLDGVTRAASPTLGSVTVEVADPPVTAEFHARLPSNGEEFWRALRELLSGA